MKIKIKGEVEVLKILKSLKKRRRKRKEEKTIKQQHQQQQKENGCKNGKDISGTFFGVVVDSLGSVHFRTVPWSGLYFSRSIGPFLCSRY